MVKNIIFINETEEDIQKKVDKIGNIVGKENIVDRTTTYVVPDILVKCNKKQWKRIKWELDLYKVYY